MSKLNPLGEFWANEAKLAAAFKEINDKLDAIILWQRERKLPDDRPNYIDEHPAARGRRFTP